MKSKNLVECVFGRHDWQTITLDLEDQTIEFTACSRCKVGDYAVVSDIALFWQVFRTWQRTGKTKFTYKEVADLLHGTKT